jgi:hypothetical protein
MLRISVKHTWVCSSHQAFGMETYGRECPPINAMPWTFELTATPIRSVVILASTTVPRNPPWYQGKTCEASSSEVRHPAYRVSVRGHEQLLNGLAQNMVFLGQYSHGNPEGKTSTGTFNSGTSLQISTFSWRCGVARWRSGRSLLFSF